MLVVELQYIKLTEAFHLSVNGLQRRRVYTSDSTSRLNRMKRKLKSTILDGIDVDQYTH